MTLDRERALELRETRSKQEIAEEYGMTVEEVTALLEGPAAQSTRRAPVPVRRDQLVAILSDVLDRVEGGDSLEGCIEYSTTEDGHMVMACYRTGNSLGQGGWRMVGEFREVPE